MTTFLWQPLQALPSGTVAPLKAWGSAYQPTLSAITCPLTCLFGPFVTSQEEELSLKVVGGTAAAWNSVCPGNTLIVCHKSTWERKDHGLEEISHLGGEYTGSCTLESDLWFLLCSHRPLFILNCSLGFRHGGCDFWNLSSLETLE